MHQAPEEPDNGAGQVQVLRRIHWITFVGYWVGFPFFISHGVMAHQPLPAVGLIPLSLSAVLACYRLIQLRKKESFEYQILLGDEQPPKEDSSYTSWLLAVLDLAIVMAELLVFALTCALTYTSWRNDFQALAAYATIFLFTDAFIHAYLFCRYIKSCSWKLRRHDCAANCPNCRGVREAAASTTPRYRDMAEANPLEGGTPPSGSVASV